MLLYLALFFLLSFGLLPYSLPAITPLSNYHRMDKGGGGGDDGIVGSTRWCRIGPILCPLRRKRLKDPPANVITKNANGPPILHTEVKQHFSA